MVNAQQEIAAAVGTVTTIKVAGIALKELEKMGKQSKRMY